MSHTKYSLQTICFIVCTYIDNFIYEETILAKVLSVYDKGEKVFLGFLFRTNFALVDYI